MVKFSDLGKSDLDQVKSQEKDRQERSRLSGLSFRNLEKKTEPAASPENARVKEVSEEERKAIYDEAIEYLTGVMDAVRRRRRFTTELAEAIIARIIEFQSPVDPLLIRAIYQDNPHEFLVHHCVNVTIFAVRMAVVLGFSKPEQEQIGLAALLHEVGMGVIPEKLIFKERKLDEQEYAIFKKRPEFAYKILKSFGDHYAFLSETALQVHECMDGSGYPVGLSGDEIHVYAQIIGLVDMYEALTHSRPQRGKFSHFAAIKQIVKTGKRRYPKKHLKALLNIFSIFPLFSYVKLNSKAIGRVVETYPQQPLRPKIEVAFDSQGGRVLAKQVINLSENSILYIVDSVSEEEIKVIEQGLGQKPYRQTQSPDAHGQDSLAVSEIDDMDGEGSAADDVIEITEADFEPSTPAIGMDASKTDHHPHSIYSAEAADSSGGFIDQGRVPFSETQKGRKSLRRKGILLAIVLVMLAGVLFRQLGLREFFSEKTDKPAVPVKFSEKIDLKKQTQLNPAAVKKPAPPTAKPAPATAPPSAPIAIATADEKDVITSRVAPAADKPRTEAIAVSVPPGEAATVVQEWGGSYPFSIKLDSFRTLKEAQSVLPAYRAKGIYAYWVRVNLGSTGVWYRIFAGFYPNERQVAAVIKEFGLKDAVVKETKYAVLIGAFSSQTAIEQELTSLSRKGYSPYVIQDGDEQTFFLLAGAFYTRKGAEDQLADLLMNGIQGQVIER